MELDARLIITISGMLISVVTSFIVVRQKVAVLEEDVKLALKRSADLDSRLDRNDTQPDLVAQRLSVLSNMMDPTNRERLHRSLERMQVKIESLESDMSMMKKMHNGRHPPVKGES